VTPANIAEFSFNWQEKRYAAGPKQVGATIPISLPTMDRDSVAAIPELSDKSDSKEALESLPSMEDNSSELGLGKMPSSQQADSCVPKM
tara:strand:- start:4 stop:270 length:267 start_codon:yes stop_codon:yes gene_type:complete